MSDFVGRLSAVPSRLHGAANITDESYDRQLRDLVTYLKQPGLIPSTTDLYECLEAISSSVHSLSFLYVLRFQIQNLQKRTKREIPEHLLPGAALWKQAVRFLRSFDPVQIRYAGSEWRQLIELVASAALAISKPVLAVKVIKDALDRLDPSSGTFTSVHLIFVKLVLLSSSYTYALPIIDRLLFHFPANTDHIHREYVLCSEHEPSVAFITDASGFSTKLTYRDHLQFFLYSAMIYMSLKKWDQASHCLSVVISSPTANSVSKIMVEAYKKWILANLLGNGKLPPASRMIAPHVIRVYQSLARPYMSLAESFEKGDVQKMSAEIDLGQSVWRADNNAGLVSQLSGAYDKYMIIKLGRMFSALTTADVLQRPSSCSKGPNDIEEFVASLVMSNTLGATLSQSSGSEGTTMLRFSLSKQRDVFREDFIRTRLMRGRFALNAILQGITQTDHALELCQENIQFIAKSKKWGGSSEKSGAVGASEAGSGYDIDEDLMGDGR